MGYASVSLDDLDRHELDDVEPDVLPIGVELRPSRVRPSVWAYEAGESSNRHHQLEQEELYVPLSGRFEIAIEEGDGGGATDDPDTAPGRVEVSPGDYLVVDPPTIRTVTALEDGRLLVVGAPNVADDAVVDE